VLLKTGSNNKKEENKTSTYAPNSCQPTYTLQFESLPLDYIDRNYSSLSNPKIQAFEDDAQHWNYCVT
jgi:hypothetical protein